MDRSYQQLMDSTKIRTRERRFTKKKLTIFWIARPRRTFCKNIKASSSSSSNWNTNQTLYQGLFGACYWLKSAAKSVLQIRLVSVPRKRRITLACDSVVDYGRVWLLLPYKVMRHGCRQTWRQGSTETNFELKIFIGFYRSYSYLLFPNSWETINNSGTSI